MPLDQKKVLDLVTAAGALSEKVAADEAVREKRAHEVEELIPDVIAALVAGGRISSGEREKVARVLRDPVVTLRFIEKLAGHRSDAENVAIGRPLVEEKRASYDSLSSSLVGVPTPHAKQSDINFLSRLGISPQ